MDVRMDTDDCMPADHPAPVSNSHQIPAYQHNQLPEHSNFINVENVPKQTHQQPPGKRKRGLNIHYLTDCKRRKV